MSRYSFVSKGRVKSGKELQARLRKSRKIELKRINAIVKAYKNPAYREKLGKAQHARFRDKRVRKEFSEKIRNFFMKNPDAFKEFLKHGKNPLKKHLRTKQKFLVRSKGEQKIANFLYENKIPCLYESISLMITKKPFRGNICTPDFYIPHWNIFVEFYGGYPLAWKKKVLKNKLYPAHRIPVIGITPAELKNLDYFLLKQGERLSRSRIARKFRVSKWIK
ncbi:hypothetical protein J4433_01705 [Candidatus Pacearchaeota archaeon]|nr:hypothetical protein [Candidatus Pacearchaeota archaeon]